jgi:RNA polymerase sigma-70 factor (ECF subfamily)
MLDDKTLIVKLKQGDQAALENIYVKYRPRLMATVCSYQLDSHQAEDILHDVFLSVLCRIEKCEITHSLYGYLRAGALNGVRDMVRRRFRRETKTASSVVAQCVPCSPCEHSIRSEESQRVEKLLHVLPDSQREVVCMRIRQGLKFEEIARIQGVSSSTARGRYRYGISRLQDLSAVQSGELPKD